MIFFIKSSTSIVEKRHDGGFSGKYGIADRTAMYVNSD
jgi:hypothetical protein